MKQKSTFFSETSVGYLFVLGFTVFETVFQSIWNRQPEGGREKETVSTVGLALLLSKLIV